jgi:hypothetical protein
MTQNPTFNFSHSRTFPCPGNLNDFVFPGPDYNVTPDSMQPVIRRYREPDDPRRPLDLLRPFDSDEMKMPSANPAVGSVNNITIQTCWTSQIFFEAEICKLFLLRSEQGPATIRFPVIPKCRGLPNACDFWLVDFIYWYCLLCSSLPDA